VTTFEWLTSVRGIRQETLQATKAVVFPDKVVFPILDLYERQVGTCWRPIEKAWMLSPSFEKRHLYLLNLTWVDVVKQNYVIIVEGVFDALVLWQSGIRNVCAMLGGDLTQEQQYLLLRFTKNHVCLLDGDGKARGVKPLLVTESWNLLVPEGLDPDEYVFKYGAEQLTNLIEGVVNGKRRSTDGPGDGGLGELRRRLGGID